MHDDLLTIPPFYIDGWRQFFVIISNRAIYLFELKLEESEIF